MHYNCILLGGCHNILVPVSPDGTVLTGFDLFLALYDPDFIILPPGIPELSIRKKTLTLNPFGIVRWNQVPQIISDDAMGWSSGQAAGVQSRASKFRHDSFAQDVVAVSNPALVDNSRLAFMVCGDVHPAELDPYEFNGEVYFHAQGYRETILSRSVLDGQKNKVAARVGDDDKPLSAPNREELAFIIKEDNKFPLQGAAKILEACASLQHLIGPLSFVNRTSAHPGRGTPRRRDPHLCQLPGMAVLVSNKFGFYEAVSLWNLRANEVVTSWLSFSQLVDETESICTWLDSDLGASFYTFGADVAFASPKSDQDELGSVFDRLISQREGTFPEWKTCSYDDLALYDLEKPHLQRRHVMITRNGGDCSFLPEFSPENHGALAITLEWPTLMLPQRAALADLITIERIRTWPRWSRSKEPPEPLDTPMCRIADTRYPRLQVSDNSPVRLSVPSIHRAVQKLFDEAGFGEFRESSHAQYQNAFIKRCGSLPEACLILKKPSFRGLLTLLANNRSQSSLGWILKDPERRVLNQIEICSMLDKSLPAMTNEYFKDSQTLPEEASQLLHLQLLERGFQLSCRFCSALLWYRAEDVGQSFTCHRCYQNQTLRSNPLWLYKLPEVVFQFFNNDADVPLLALFQLLLRSTKNFQYVLDSEVLTNTNAKAGNNLDFACLTDGKVYVGEAKSNASVDDQQFSFYEKLVTSSALDGIVFATSEAKWNPSVVTRVESLKAKYKGDVILLTKSEILDGQNVQSE